jgi:hypothetical protein
MNTDEYRALNWDKDPILRALVIVLARWESREPGRVLTLPGCNYAALVSYSPNYRVLHYRLSDGTVGWITRRAYLENRKS